MPVQLKKTLRFFIISILIPYVTLIFSGYTGDVLIYVPIILIALVAIVISTSKIVVAEPTKLKKWVYVVMSIAAVVFFFSIQSKAFNWLFFKFREKKLVLFTTELKKYKKIKEMTDGQRFWKSVNFTSIEPTIAEVDTSSKYNKKYLLDDILRRDGLNKERYEFFRGILIETNLISFTTLQDGTLSFTIDGFLDNCYGIAYSESGKRPSDNDCGSIIKWEKIGSNWYAWATT